MCVESKGRREKGREEVNTCTPGRRTRRGSQFGSLSSSNSLPNQSGQRPTRTPIATPRPTHQLTQATPPAPSSQLDPSYDARDAPDAPPTCLCTSPSREQEQGVSGDQGRGGSESADDLEEEEGATSGLPPLVGNGGNGVPCSAHGWPGKLARKSVRVLWRWATWGHGQERRRTSR